MAPASINELVLFPRPASQRGDGPNAKNINEKGEIVTATLVTSCFVV